MRNYQEVLNIIENSRRFENRPGVEIAGIMLEKLGNPQQGMRFIHVAGTNGKGSTCAFLNSILTQAGMKVGVFTSPHLIDFEERIAIGSRRISREDVVRLGNMLLNTDFGVTPTMFDYCMAMAVIYFREQQCDIAIMETGLGGRLDSTNAIGIPEVSVITKIGFDHTAFLGNTLREIASEKAGILKPGTYAVIESQEKEAEQLFRKVLEDKAIQHSFVTQEDIDYVSKLGINMAGVHQWANGAAAMLASRHILGESQNVEKGLRTAVWGGRMEQLSEHPLVIVDGAHNSNGVTALRDSLVPMYPGEKFHFYMGVMADKDYEEMVELLLPLAKDFVTVTPESDRALQAEELATCIRARGVKAYGVNSVEEAISEFSQEGINLVFGSLYFIGEMKAKYDK